MERSPSPSTSTTDAYGKKARASPLEVSFSIVRICAGVGLLALPHAFSQSGFIIGAVAVFVVGALNVLAIRFLLETKEAALGLFPGNCDSYTALAYQALGVSGIYVVRVSILFTLMGISAVYLITIGSLMSEIAPLLSPHSYVIICFLLLLPLAFLPMDRVHWVSMFGNLAYFVGYATIFWVGAVHYGFPYKTLPSTMLPQGSTLNVSLSGIIRMLGVISFAFGIPVMAFQLEESMDDRRKFLNTVTVTVSAVSVLYLIIAIAALAMFAHAPGGIPEIMLSSLSDSSLAVVVKVLVVVTIFASIPLSISSSVDILENMSLSVKQSQSATTTPLLAQAKASQKRRESSGPGKGAKGKGKGRPEEIFSVDDDRDLNDEEWHQIYQLDDSTTHASPVSSASSSSSSSSFAIQKWLFTSSGSLSSNTLRLVIPLIVTVIAIMVPCFTLVMSLIGCITLGILSFILPPIFYLVFARQRLIEPSTWDQFCCYTLLLFGVSVMIIGTGVALVNPRCS